MSACWKVLVRPKGGTAALHIVELPVGCSRQHTVVGGSGGGGGGGGGGAEAGGGAGGSLISSDWRATSLPDCALARPVITSVYLEAKT